MALKMKSGAASKPASKPATQESASADPFAQSYNDAKDVPKGLPVGAYEVRVTDGGITESETTNKTVAWYEVTVENNDDDGLNGRTQRIFYQLVNDDGELLQGFDFLKADHATMGMHRKVKDRDDLESLIAEVVEAGPLLKAVAAQSKKDPQYVNLFIKGLLEEK